MAIAISWCRRWRSSASPWSPAPPASPLAALLLFATNVAAILASGIVVMALYRVRRAPGQTTAPAFGYRGAVVIIAALLLAVIVPLTISSNRIDKTTIRQTDV